MKIAKQIIKNPSVLATVLIVLGIVFSPGSVDVGGLKTGATDIASSGKLWRIATVLLAAAIIFMSLVKRGGLGLLLKGNFSYITIYGLLGISTVAFSQLKMMTVFKGFEILVACMIGVAVYMSKDRISSANTYIRAVFWIYVISVGSALAELAVFGTAGHKELVGETPLLSSMMETSYPPMVGNALGYLGALVAFFGVYYFDNAVRNKDSSKLLGSIIFIAGVTVLFLSYTRSVLLFFVLALMFYFYLEKKIKRIIVILFLGASIFALPGVHDKVLDHLRRGSTDQQLESMSGRTDFWVNIFSRNMLNLIVGEGFATGHLFQDYSESSMFGSKIAVVRNAHNSIAEITISSGFIGVTVWLLLLFRIFRQLLKIRYELKRNKSYDQLLFHHMIMAVFVLSCMRSLMNNTFVYLTYFYFLLIALAAYGECYVSDLRRIRAEANKPVI
ncbi:MAG: O-antigen ligase family protein [Gammaproteobacteria bacterium]|nr:O-antigen ligase family protein [Gammaproteobacteria bacterium]